MDKPLFGLAKIRHRLGMTQREAAWYTGLKLDNYVQKERRSKWMTTSELQEFAEKIGLIR